MDRGLIVARARAMLGWPFRLHGRDAAGIDCVGVAARALDLDDVPGGYPLRGDGGRWIAMLDARLRRVTAAGAGDVIAACPGPGQLHLGIWTGAGLVHADLGLGRVVERPGAVPWRVIGCWRREE